MGTQDRHQEDGDSKVTDLTPSGRGCVSSTWKFPALVANSEVTWGSHPAPPQFTPAPTNTYRALAHEGLEASAPLSSGP